VSLCDWCDVVAQWVDAAGDAGHACDVHRRELERLVEARAFRSGNRWTEEAVTSAVREVRS
jgi:hypothetical protein